MAILTHRPISIRVDREAGLAMICQQFGDHPTNDSVNIEISRDQAMQIAEFLTKEFKIKASERTGGDPQGFDVFWAEYPNKEAKQTALSIWKRDKCAAVADKIVADVKRRKDSKQWRDGFIPHPTTYLRQRRYEDEQSQEQHNPWDGAL